MMQGFQLSIRSLAELQPVKCEMRAIVRRALIISPVDFGVLDGARTKEEQARFVASGASQTMDSKHLLLLAVDLFAWVKGKLSWEWAEYQKIATAMKQAANEMRVPLQWGGDWPTLKDGGHFHLVE